MKEYGNPEIGKNSFEGILRYVQKRRQNIGDNFVVLISKILITYLGLVFGCKVK